MIQLPFETEMPFVSDNITKTVPVTDALRPAAGAKTVGVMTLPLNSNYGGNLQTFALMQALKKLGHRPILINLRHPTQPDPAQPAAPPTSEDAIPLMAETVGLGKSVPNTSFTDTYLRPVTRIFSTPDQLARQLGTLGLDAVVSGSDQIWRPKFARTLLTNFYFFGFLPDDSPIRRISYAASFGVPEWEFSEEQTRTASALVRKFDGLSVREDRGVELCQEHLGVKAEHVLDPTLLLSPEDYLPILATAPRARVPGQLLTYLLDASEDKIAAVHTLAQRLSLRVSSTDNRPFPAAGDSTKGDWTVQGWLASFYNAAFVVTDSFHGVAFSILFNKPFIAYGNPGRGLARFTSMLKLVGLEDRLVLRSSDIDVEKMVQPVNWERVNTLLAERRVASFAFLDTALTAEAGTGPSTLTPQKKSVPEQTAAVPITNPLNVLCTGCGVCVSESKGALRMVWDNQGYLVPRAMGKPIPPETIRVCPFNPNPDADVKDEDKLGEIFLQDAENYDPRVGRFKKAYAGYSKTYRPTASSGGVATYVFEQLLARGDVDHLFIVQGDGDKGYRYRIFDKSSDISTISKTRYFPVTLDELFTIIDSVQGRIAVSGVACFIKAIRLKQHYHPELKIKIPFLVGIICGGLKSRYFTDFLAQSAGIRSHYADPQYRVKNPDSTALDYSFAATDEKEHEHQIRMQRVGDMWGTGLFKARACDFCTDGLTELSDISLGDAWLPEYKPDGLGHNVIVTRTALAEDIIQSGIRAGDLVIDELPIERVIRSQLAGVNHKQGSIAFRAWMGKNIFKLPVPHIRSRFMKKVTAAEALVQILRERTRARSLKAWTITRDSSKFSRRMRATLVRLRLVTAARTAGNIDSGIFLRHLDRSISGSIETKGLRNQPMRRWLIRKIGSQELAPEHIKDLLLLLEDRENPKS